MRRLPGSVCNRIQCSIAHVINAAQTHGTRMKTLVEPEQARMRRSKGVEAQKICPPVLSTPKLRKIEVALIDLSGTLHIGNHVTPGAPEALKRLRQAGVAVRFVTNTTKESSGKLFQRLVDLGFEIEREEIFSSLVAARDHLRQHRLRPYLMVHDEALDDFEEFKKTTNHNAVLVGLAPEKFVYSKLNEAFQVLLNGGQLIAIHKGRYYRDDCGLSLGPGPFVAALEYATEAQAQVVGKPNLSFFQSALSGLTDDPLEAVMIGDDIIDDIQGALTAGMGAILVKTGKYLAGDELKSKPTPNAHVANFSAAVDFILEHNHAQDSADQ